MQIYTLVFKGLAGEIYQENILATSLAEAEGRGQRLAVFDGSELVSVKSIVSG